MNQEATELIRGAVMSAPLSLLTLKTPELIDAANKYLPYSVGMEIECDRGVDYKSDSFNNIPDIMDVSNSDSEQRYRIPKGIRGLVCLYNICEQLKYNSELNPDSGIHYHVDMTDVYYSIANETSINSNKEWILAELDTWNYKGTYNIRGITISTGHMWIRNQDYFRTAEFRIGEMSFDYRVLVKRITHASDIIRRWRLAIGVREYQDEGFPPVDISKIVTYLNTLETTIESDTRELEEELAILERDEISYLEIANSVIKNRIVKV